MMTFSMAGQIRWRDKGDDRFQLKHSATKALGHKKAEFPFTDSVLRDGIGRIVHELDE